ncbi:MAG: serine/threonine-protein kinase [Gemmatimonadaceae bacterium]
MSQEKICPTCGTEYPANERFCPRDGTALRSQSGSTDLVGSIIAERYHVIKKLGEGGMGQVYLAEHVKMGRKSAVKVMNPGMVNDADAISRFNREAANASRINHPNVAGIYDFGETSEGLIYLAMEFIEGESLTSLVEKSGALPPIRAARITQQAAAGLQVAHDMGIVHRDLKPDNIMIAKNRDGTDLVKVVDFGIAKAAGAENQKVTKTGLVVGTPEYMSPEQLSGDKLDGKSDVYSLALVAFNMFTGKLPFPSETAQESMIMRLTDEPKSLREMNPKVIWPPAIESVMKRALQRKSAERYTSASDFGNALIAAVESMPKQQQADATMVMGAAAATAMMQQPPATRVDPDVGAAARRSMAGAAQPAAPAVPVKSKMPLIAGGGAAAAAAAVAVFFVMSKGGTPSVKPDTTATVPPAVTGAPVNPVTDPASPTSRQKVNTGMQTPSPNALNAKSSIPKTAAAMSNGSAPSSTSVSYMTGLDALASSINDESSARSALAKIEDLEAKITLPADKAALAFVEAKANMLAVGAEKGCRMMRLINRERLSGTMKSDLNEAIQSCASP